MRIFPLVLVCMVMSSFVNAQLNNSVFENRMIVQPADSNKLYLGLNILGFAKNNEYFGTTVDGYTLFGYQFNPYLSYHISPKIRLDGGIYLQKDFGNDTYTQVAPTFSLKYQERSWALIFGTLEGSLNHRLIEPLYDFEKVLNDRLENGIQFLWMKDGIFLDAWVDWQNMIYLGDSEQEEFTFGLSASKRVYKGNSWSLEIPFQLTAQHRGGQIDQSNDPVTTYYNLASGLHLLGESHAFLDSWGIQAYGVLYKDANASGTQPFEDGYSIYLNPYITTHFGLTVMAGYWYANEFISTRGGLIYPSANELYPTRIDQERQVVILRALYNFRLAESFWLTARAEPFIDSYSESIQLSFGIYLNFYDRYLLTSTRNNR